MSYIFSLVPQTPPTKSAANSKPNHEIPVATTIPSDNTSNPKGEERTTASNPLPTGTSTSPSDSLPAPLWGFPPSGGAGGGGGESRVGGGGINPVLAFYARRLTAQSESLSFLIQNSLSEITQKQTNLAELLCTSGNQVKHLEEKVSEVVGRVGVEVEQILVQLRGVLSTTNSVLLAIDGKIVEVESGSVGLVRRVARIEREVGGVREGVERVERIVIGMQRRLDGLVEVVDGLASSAFSSFKSAECGCSENNNNDNNNNNTTVKNTGKKGKRTRRRMPSFEIPCSSLGKIENTPDVAFDEVDYESASIAKKPRLTSEDEITKMEKEELRRERDAEAAEYAYTEEPDVNSNEDGLGRRTCSINIDDQELEKMEVFQEWFKTVDEDPVKGAAEGAVVKIPKRRILLTTQELEELLE